MKKKTPNPNLYTQNQFVVSSFIVGTLSTSFRIRYVVAGVQTPASSKLVLSVGINLKK